MVAVAKRPIKPSEVLDGEGGYTAYGVLVEASQAAADRLLPIGLCHGAKIVRAIEEGKMLGHLDVDMPKGGCRSPPA